MGEASVKRSLNDVLEVELNFVGFRRIRESIEGLLRCSLNTFDNPDDSINLRLIDQDLRPIDEQTNVFAKLDVSGQLHYDLLSALFTIGWNRASAHDTKNE